MELEDIKNLELEIEAERLKRERDRLRFMNQQAALNTVPAQIASAVTLTLQSALFSKG